MSRLIDADELFRQDKEEWICTNNAPFISTSYARVFEEIYNAPTVDAIPRSEIEAALEEMVALEETEFHMPNTDYEAYAVAYHCVEILKKHMEASATE